MIELGAVHELRTSCPAANPYLVAELGGQQLLCQPLLRCEGPQATFNQRFVVFLTLTLTLPLTLPLTLSLRPEAGTR